MKKVSWLFLGLIIGGIIGAVGCGLIWCVDDFLSCGESSMNEGSVMTSGIVCGIIGGLIGLIAGACSDSEDAQYEANRKYQAWENDLKSIYNQMMKSCYVVNSEQKPAYYHNRIKQMWSNAVTSDSRYKTTYDNYWNFYYNELKNHLRAQMSGNDAPSGIPGLPSLVYALNLVECFNELYHTDESEKSVEVLTTAISLVFELPFMHITQTEYGVFDFPMDNPELFDKQAVWISIGGINKLKTFVSDIYNSNQDIIQILASGKLLSFIKSSVTSLWYYAKLKPFDVENFNTATDMFNRYTVNFAGDKNIIVPKVEVLLAKIYAKNQLGGISLVRQEMDSINTWMASGDSSWEDATYLASGLAWMELYEIELFVLRKSVELGVQLPADIQERLSFLESGGTANIRIYDIAPSKDFVFDNSSLDWNNNDYSVFFRKLSMKKMDLNYSLAQSKWTKTLPLASGQKVSAEALAKEFDALVADYDGEVVNYSANAKAVNLVNLEYPNAMIFKFNSERNRCISMLFYCEKYGRNLNLTIITMFTPDNSLSAEALEKYCSAIKNNMYIDSFKESILQTVDTVVKEKQSVYGDSDETPTKKNIID